MGPAGGVGLAAARCWRRAGQTRSRRSPGGSSPIVAAAPGRRAQRGAVAPLHRPVQGRPPADAGGLPGRDRDPGRVSRAHQRQPGVLRLARADLPGGDGTGWDLIALSDWVVALLVEQGWIEGLDWSLLPTVDQNLLPGFRDPAYDPGNAHSVPWQGGVTGIAYHPDLVGGQITAFADLWDPKLAGHVGMLTEMVDTMSLTLLSLGIEPLTATLDDAMKAQERLLEQRDAGIVRQYYGQDYIDDLVNENTWATMAWSGDVFFWKYLGGAPDLEFIVPEEGGLLWSTPLEIPALAEHPRDAHLFMDYYYRPEVAVQVTDWVLYMTPVDGVRELMLEKAAGLKGADRAYFETLADSPLLFPPEDLARGQPARVQDLHRRGVRALGRDLRGRDLVPG